MDDSNEPILEHYEKLNTSEFSAVNPKIQIKSIEFFGLKRTYQEFLLNTLKGAKLDESQDLFELSLNLTDAFGRLERLNIFKNVSVTIDEAEQENKQESSDVHNVKIIFNCKEKRFNIRTGTELQRKDIAWVKEKTDRIFKYFIILIL
jgi:hypothetical protein